MAITLEVMRAALARIQRGDTDGENIYTCHVLDPDNAGIYDMEQFSAEDLLNTKEEFERRFAGLGKVRNALWVYRADRIAALQQWIAELEAEEVAEAGQ